MICATGSVADQVQFGYADKRQVIETADVASRLAMVAELLRREIARARVAGEVQAKTAVTIDRAQRGAQGGARTPVAMSDRAPESGRSAFREPHSSRVSS